MTAERMNPLDDETNSPAAIAAEAAAQARDKLGIERVDIAVTLGSGWGRAAERFGTEIASVAAEEVVGFSAPKVPGHGGKLQVFKLPNGGTVLVIGARTHYYEGHGVRRTVHSVRTAAALGARVMVLTNGAGGLRETWTPGTPVLISDHINLTAASPIEGAHFVDLTDLYASRLRTLALTVAPELDEGVYTQFRGPHYETPAEVRMVGNMGGDIVGMSTALEAIAAREAGMEVLGFSLITNLAAGISSAPLDHEEVLSVGKASEEQLGELLSDVVSAVADDLASDAGVDSGEEVTR